MGRPKPLWFLIPGDIDTPTGGYRFDRRIVDGLTAAGWAVTLARLDDSFPWPTSAALDEADRCLARIPDGTLVIVDGLAFGAMPQVAARHGGRLRLIALVHHPLALETGLTSEQAQALHRSETQALAFTRLILVTSGATARKLIKDYAVAADRIGVVEPGVASAPLAVGSGGPALNLLCVAAPTPRKGHDVLLRALAPLMDRSWQLNCVGSLARCPATVLALQRQCIQLGLTERVHFTGAVDETRLVDYYRHADLFVLPTRFEGYGMVLTEALASGLPIISTATGPIPGIVPPQAGSLVAPDDPVALQQALAAVLDDPSHRNRLAAGARRVRARLRTWDAATAGVACALQEVSHG